MPIREPRERETNFPGVLGRKNYPREGQWSGGPLRSIASMPSAVGGVGHKGILPQRSMHGLRRETRKMSVYAEDAIRFKNAQMGAQLTGRAIFPLFDRPKPLIQSIKERAPIISRTKLLGAFGLVGQASSAGMRPVLPASGRNIANPRGARRWPATMGVARMPSVVADTLTSGPRRTMHPSGHRGLSVEV